MPRVLRATVAAALFLASAGRAVWALDPERAVTQYVVGSWRAPQSLPHDDVTSIIQTHDGYLWVGTVEGLARFDGVRSVVFDRSNTPAIANNWVKALLEDRAGRLWIATFGGGLVCREGGRFVRYGEKQGLSQDIILSLYEDREGGVWAGTHGAGFFRLDGDRFARVPGTQAAEKSSIRAFLKDRAGILWIGAEDGLYRIAHGAMTRLTRADGLTDNTILALAEDADGLWIGTEAGGLDRLSAGRITAITTREGLTHNRIWCLSTDRDGNLWIGTDGGGLDRLTRGRLTALTTKNGLRNDYVWAIREDREGSLWIGTNGGGLVRLKSGPVLPITTREGLPSDFIWAILRTRDGVLWIGTEDAGLARLKDGRITTFTTRDGLASNQVKVFLERHDGSVWIGGDNGVDIWASGNLRHAEIPGLEHKIVNALAEDALWIGSNSDGLLRLKDGRVERFDVARGLSDQSVSTLLTARDGSLWIATLGGIDRLVGDRVVSSFSKKNGLPNDYATSLFEDPDGTIWAGTRGGLVRIRGDRVESLTSRQGLLEDSVALAIPDRSGSIWIGGNRGLFRVSRREIDETLAGRRPRVHATAFGLEEGMRSVELNGSGSSDWCDADGLLWFATRGGIACVQPSRFAKNRLVPPVVIEEVLADGRALAAPGPWLLTAGTRHIELHYTALSFRVPSRVRIERRLEGFDPDWVTSGPSRSAEYTNLPHGRYLFRVIAANEDGVWNQTGAEVAFEIEPRFHERPWFRALVVLFLAVVGPLFYYVRVRRLRRQKAELEHLVAARTAEVEAANARLARLAREDGLTGVANRRLLDETLQEEWRRARRMGTSFAYLLLDIDFFKAYNDRLGHQMGDASLKAVAAAITGRLERAGELVGRYGGEEFAAILPGASRADARAVAEKVRADVQALALPHPGSTVAPVVTVSIGYAWARPRDGGTPEDLVAAADLALYRAKQSGRNRVEPGSDTPAPV